MNQYMVGVDIGTTSAKAVLYTAKGEVVQSAQVEYPLHTPDAATAEQDPDEMFRAVLQTVGNVTKAHPDKKPSFIAFSSVMHSVMAVDREGRPLTRCITWADTRSKAWARKIKTQYPGHEIYKRTGTPIHPMSPLCKIAWLVHDCPQISSRAKKYIGIKEYVFLRLFGRYVVDHSVASSTGLLNLESLDWDEEALRIAGIARGQLSDPVPTTAMFTGCDPLLAERMGIDPRTPFVIGASDGVLSNVGVNAMRPGEVAVTIGTSGAIRTVVDKPQTDREGRTFCYVLAENAWVVGGPVNNGGIVLRWIRDELVAEEVKTAGQQGIDPYDALTSMAEKVPPGANELLFHPYLSGERAPLWNADARGSFFGLTLAHKKEHLIRAAMEGVIFNLHAVFEAVTACMDHPVTRIHATGGFARSKVWRQMLADIFDCEVAVPEDSESSCLGACILGLYATREIAALDQAAFMTADICRHTPDPAAVKVYRKLIPIYTDVMRALERQYAEIAAFQRNRH